MGETLLRCHEDGSIERFHKYKKEWQFVKGSDCNGHLQIGIDGKKYYIHRIIYKCFNPDMDETLCIDHINRIRNDNRLENLRLVTNQQNQFNTDSKGFYKHGTGFQGQINLNGITKTKTFRTEDEARNWYFEQKEILHIIHGEPNII